MRIGLDLDGVMYPFVAVLRNWFEITRHWTTERMPEPEHFHFGKDWGLERDEFVREMSKAVDAGHLFRLGEPTVGADILTKALHNEGHTVHIVTHREGLGQPGVAEAATVRWLTRWGIEYDSITFADDKTIVKTDMFLEDNVKNVQKLEAAGTAAYLMDQSYNREFATAGRVTTLYEFLASVRSVSQWAHALDARGEAA